MSGAERVERRPSWDEYFLRIAVEVAGRSTCLRRQVGAVVVRDKRILATGYNGVPRNLAHCSEVGCRREAAGAASGTAWELCRGLHAEMNALIQAARFGIAIEGATLYTTTSPCVLCAKMIINAAITEVVACDAYPDELSREMLAEAGVVVRMVDRPIDP